MSDDRDLLEEVQRLIAGLEAHPDPAVRADATALLKGIDAVHRTALTRLVAAIQSMAGEAFLNRLAADPAVRLLLMSYGLLAVDRRLLAEEALDTVRGHLHAHGIDVELTEVVGGAVYVRLHARDACGLDVDALRRDLEEALREGFIGFQELVIGERPTVGSPLLQVGGLRPARRPVYRRACAVGDLTTGGLAAVEIEGEPVLLARVDDEIYAVANRCGESPLPLHLGTLEGAVVQCPWHRCRYDVRTGESLERGAGRLAVFPVRVEGDEIQVAVGTAAAE